MTSHRNSVQLITLQDEDMALGRCRVPMKVPIARKPCVPGQSQVPLTFGGCPSGQALLTSDSSPREAAVPTPTPPTPGKEDGFPGGLGWGTLKGSEFTITHESQGMVSWLVRNESERVVGPLRMSGWDGDTLGTSYLTILGTLPFLRADLGYWVFHRARMDRTPAMSNVVLPV